MRDVCGDYVSDDSTGDGCMVKLDRYLGSMVRDRVDDMLMIEVIPELSPTHPTPPHPTPAPTTCHSLTPPHPFSHHSQYLQFRPTHQPLPPYPTSPPFTTPDRRQQPRPRRQPGQELPWLSRVLQATRTDRSGVTIAGSRLHGEWGPIGVSGGHVRHACLRADGGREGGVLGEQHCRGAGVSGALYMSDWGSGSGSGDCDCDGSD